MSTDSRGDDPQPHDFQAHDRIFDELDDMARSMADDPTWDLLQQMADDATDDPELAGLLRLVDDAAASLQRDVEVQSLTEKVAAELGYKTHGPVQCIQQMKAEIITLRAEIIQHRRNAAAT